MTPDHSYVCDYHGPEKRGTCPYIEEATSKAVRDVFAILGVDIDQPKDVEQFRVSLRFGDSMRKAADKSLLAFVVIVTGGVCTALWWGIKTRITAP